MRPREPCFLHLPLLLARAGAVGARGEEDVHEAHDGGAAHVERERAEDEGRGDACALELGARVASGSLRRASRAGERRPGWWRSKGEGGGKEANSAIGIRVGSGGGGVGEAMAPDAPEAAMGQGKGRRLSLVL
ncbi:hypothetical protein DFH09DRAFT_1483919 [Mycena vulgaris]|nr:hypothetical protein DFH09DRAFT_1483919 [Mycena vulgaris]